MELKAPGGDRCHTWSESFILLKCKGGGERGLIEKRVPFRWGRVVTTEWRKVITWTSRTKPSLAGVQRRGGIVSIRSAVSFDCLPAEVELDGE